MSGIVRTAKYDNQGYNLALSWKVQSQSVKNNTTLLSYRIYADNDAGSSYWIAYYQTSVSINGTNVYSSPSRISGYKNQTLKTGTISIPHNSDGSKSVNISLQTNMYYSGSNTKTGSSTITLPTINRGIYNIQLASGWTDLDANKTITFNKYNENTTVNIKWQYWNVDNDSRTDEYIIRDPNGSSLDDNYYSGKQIKFQDAFIKDIHEKNPYNKSAKVYIKIRTYVEGRLIQSIEKTANLRLKVEVPDISTLVRFTGKNQNLLGNSKRGLAGVHQLNVVINANAKNGANIRNYEVTFEGKSFTSTKNTFTINTSSPGSKTVKAKAVDTRGLVSIKNDTVNVISYSPPSVRHRAYRMDGATEDPLGTTARISGNIIIDDVKNSSNKSVNAAWWYLDIDGNTTRNTASIMYSERLSIETSKFYKLRYGDNFTTSGASGAIPTGKAPLVLEEEAVGVNMIPPKGSKGLYVKDGLVNGSPILNTLTLYADYKTYGDSNYSAAVTQNWSKIPEGVSVANLNVGSQGVAIIHKYSGNLKNLYGSFICFGLSSPKGNVKRFILFNGSWKEGEV